MINVQKARDFLFMDGSYHGGLSNEVLINALRDAFETAGYHGGFVEAIDEYLENTLLIWDKLPEQIPRVREYREELFAMLAKAAEAFKERDPRQLPFVRQMECFVKLLTPKVIIIETRFNYGLSEVGKMGRLSYKEKALLFQVVNAREKVFKDFSKRSLMNYSSKFRRLGLRAGLSEAVMSELEDELLIDLEWFHHA